MKQQNPKGEEMKILLLTPALPVGVGRVGTILLSEFSIRNGDKIVRVHNTPSLKELLSGEDVRGLVIYGTGEEKWLVETAKAVLTENKVCPVAFIWTKVSPEVEGILEIRRHIGNVHDDTAMTYFYTISDYFSAYSIRAKK